MGKVGPGMVEKAPHNAPGELTFKHRAECKTQFFLSTEKVYFCDVLVTENANFN